MDSYPVSEGKKSGRKKLKEEEKKKKKQPKRGKGVAGLELEIWQDNMKKMGHDFSAFHPLKLLHGHTYFPSFPDPVPITVPERMPVFGGFSPVSHVPSPLGLDSGLILHGFGNVGFSGSGSGFAGEGFSGQFQGDPYGFGAPDPRVWGRIVDEPSKELTSKPPYLEGFSDRCGVCQKKQKKCASNREKEEDLDTKEVEVVAVRRKGMNGSGLVMEYEFFPAKGGGSGGGYWGEKVAEASPTSSSCVTNASASATTTSGGYDSMLLSNSVDLSLKLSL